MVSLCGLLLILIPALAQELKESKTEFSYQDKVEVLQLLKKYNIGTTLKRKSHDARKHSSR